MAIDIRRLTRLTIGINTESGVEEYRFDMLPWLEEHPGLHTFQLNVTPPGGMPYKAETHMDGDVLVWPITASDTALPGDDGWYEIEAFGDNGLHKLSPKRPLVVLERMVGDMSDAPQTIQNWVEEANEVLENNREATLAAEKSAAAAEKAAEEAEKAIDATEKATEKAEAATEAAEAVIKGAVVRNLLDNSDFRNPVNQRGATSYTGTGVYTIDRWIIGHSANNSSVEITSDGIKVSPVSGGYADFSQKFENYSAMAGKTYTVAFNILGSGVYVQSFTMGSAYLPSSSIQFHSTADRHFIIRGTEPFTIVWAALYEGEYTAETLPTYQPKGYAAELAECQRYYRKHTTYSLSGVCTTAGWAAFGYDYTGMRATPTVTADAEGMYHSGTKATAITNFSARTKPASEIICATSNLAQNTICVIRFNSLELSADL